MASLQQRSSGREVRLFPSSHISSDREAELRATASLLAVLRAVSEFGRAIVRRAGGPAGTLSCYTEVPFELQRRGRPPETVRPDGIIVVERGRTKWTALVEAKVGSNNLDQEQVDRYHQLAGQEGIDAVLTVSNQAALPNGQPPLHLDGRRLRAVPVRHFSWERLLSEAQVLSRKKAISDPDQKWMLDEWIRYADDPNSRIIVPPELGPHWNEVLKEARTGSLKKDSPELRDVASRWAAYLSKAALQLRAELGADVRPRLSRAERSEPYLHVDRLVEEACVSGSLSGALVVPDAAGDVRIEVFLHSKSVRYAVVVEAPTEGRQATRLRWLGRQLRRLPDLPGDLLVTVVWSKRGLTSTCAAGNFVQDVAAASVDPQGVLIDKSLMPRRFVVHTTGGLQAARGRSTARVAAGITEGLRHFYRGVVEGLVPYVPPAPRLPREAETESPQGDADGERSVEE